MAEDSSSKKFLSFKRTLKYVKDDLSLVQLGSHLRIEESLRVQESNNDKGKEVGEPSVNMKEAGKNKHNKQNKVVKITTQILVVRERVLRTNPKTKVDAIAWWIDSGATTHVCKDRCWFKTYESVKDGSGLYMGDEHFAPVHGKGSVALEFSSEKVYESDKYILLKSGVFVGFGYYNNGMFMLNLNKVPDDSDSVYMSSSTVVNSSLWHALLGHVHYKRMLEMSKDDLIPAIDENPENVLLHSKAYRFYVIEPNESVSINSIVEARDALSDENCFFTIPIPKDVIPNLIDSQRDDHTDDVPIKRRILEPNEAMQSRDATFWKEEIDDEIGFIMKNNTWVLSDLPPICKPLGNEHKVCKLVKSLYGLKQAPKQWRQKFDEVVLSSGFHLNQSEKYVYSKFDSSDKGVIVCLYVDDMLIFGTDQYQVDKTKKFLASMFSMKDMGEVDVILGIKIKRENKRIVITQSHYIKKILKKFNNEDCSLVSNPMDPVEKLKPNTGKPVDHLEYSRAIGCLMYLMTSTRPDIAYAVGRLSRFTSNPSRQHWQAITKVFKYLKGTMNYGLSYFGYPSVCVISWAFKKQACITGSTMEFEFVALAAAGKEAYWLRNLIHEIPV
uniref:Zinc finger, CCHC-type n=1 Tax=Tanacetum cinerariifolium TaxID=118510 RepID=A0A6L2KV93_TANCI|nr:zinc finger, CCHC-type [Tanacetum cinerariifolium]